MNPMSLQNLANLAMSILVGIENSRCKVLGLDPAVGEQSASLIAMHSIQ